MRAENLTQHLRLGIHGRKRAGTGEEFWQFRQARQEDAHRAIDWRQSAKNETLFVRERELEAANRVAFHLSNAPSMMVRSNNREKRPEKFERGALILLCLSILLQKTGDMIAFGNMPFSNAPNEPEKIAYQLADHEKASQPITMAKILSYGKHATKKNLYFLISDFYEDPELLDKEIKTLRNQGHDGVAIQITMPEESNFNFQGAHRFTLGEDALDVMKVQAIHEEYHTLYQQHQEALRNVFKKNGFMFFAHRTDEDIKTFIATLIEGLQNGL